jgi:hypothetical protein
MTAARTTALTMLAPTPRVPLAPADGRRVSMDDTVFLAAAPKGGEPMLGQEPDLWITGELAPELTPGFGGSAFIPRYSRKSIAQD